MRKLGLRHLYKHLGKEIKKLPFEITDHNKSVAVVFPVDDEFYSKSEGERLVELHTEETKRKLRKK